jgi:hypothetical protein
VGRRPRGGAGLGPSAGLAALALLAALLVAVGAPLAAHAQRRGGRPAGGRGGEPARAAPAVPARTDAPAAEVTLAREQFRLGVAAARENRWWDALEAFRRSYELQPRPATLLNLAGALAETGKLVEAAEAYRRFVLEADGRAAEQVPAAQEAIASLEQRIARVTLVVENLGRNDRVLLDDVPLASAALGTDLPVDPGAHVLRVERGDREIGRTDFEVTEGQRRVEPIRLRVAPPAEDEERDGGDGESGGSVFSSPWFWVITGVVVVGAGVGIGVAAASNGLDPFRGNIPPGAWEVR